MKGEAKHTYDQMKDIDKEVERLKAQREDLWCKLREIQNNCDHKFKKEDNPVPAEYWVDDCIECGKVVVS